MISTELFILLSEVSFYIYIYQNTSSWNKTIIYNMSVACMRDRYIDPNFQILCMHSYSSPYNYFAMLFLVVYIRRYEAFV